MPIREGFFAYLEDIAGQGGGFEIFDRTHLLMLGCLSVLIVLLCVIYRLLSVSGRAKMLKVVALTTFTMEAVRQLTFPLLQGHYWIENIPLHLCAIAIFIEMFHAFFPNKTTKEILYCLCLPGAVSALLFPNWTMYTLQNFYCLQSFTIHALHVAFPLMLLTSGEHRPNAKQLWRAVLFLAIILPPIYFLNHKLSTNFFFINAGSEGSPLEIFIEWMGVPGFLIPYACLLAIVWLLMYLPWHIRRKRA